MSSLLVLCNCPDAATARQLATAVVEQRLAACVNCLPAVQSIYRWDGEVQSEQEATLLIKTIASRYSELEARLAELHPYDVPEIIALDISRGLPAYLNWLEQSVQ